ncbi:hypothetical protein [Micromonospora sp. CPCC 205558]|uniref:hypothetical protein n=1 Tax=Micromonospora sp. CPCC 205558 TaxID=3122403 RepID=UPI002FF0D9F0
MTQPGISVDDSTREALGNALAEMGSALMTARNAIENAKSDLAGDYTGQSAIVYNNGLTTLNDATTSLENARSEIEQKVAFTGKISSSAEESNFSAAQVVAAGLAGGASWT